MTEREGRKGNRGRKEGRGKDEVEKEKVGKEKRRGKERCVEREGLELLVPRLSSISHCKLFDCEGLLKN